MKVLLHGPKLLATAKVLFIYRARGQMPVLKLETLSSRILLPCGHDDITVAHMTYHMTYKFVILKTLAGKSIPDSDLSEKLEIWRLRAAKTRPLSISPGVLGQVLSLFFSLPHLLMSVSEEYILPRTKHKLDSMSVHSCSKTGRPGISH